MKHTHAKTGILKCYKFQQNIEYILYVRKILFVCIFFSNVYCKYSCQKLWSSTTELSRLHQFNNSIHVCSKCNWEIKQEAQGP